MSLAHRWQCELDRLRGEGRYRTLTVPTGIDFSSNDYLGYSKRLPPASELACSGAASRLLRGQHAIWEEVEARLADWHRTESALVFSSGYAANEGLLGTIAEPGDVIFSDQLNHASIIDGIRLSRADKSIFPHNDVDSLAREMGRRRESRRANQAWFIVTESLFGMEGDLAPLADLAELARRHDAHLIVDEAHATGCFGDTGAGLVDALDLRDRVLATVHTGGKALAVPGAYIAGSKLLRETLINRCRHFIFTTALPPRIGVWWRDAIEHSAGDTEARAALHQKTRQIRKELSLSSITVGGSQYIVSIVMGDDRLAVDSARALQSHGFDVRAIRPPTVPIGTARLRISIHADHDADVLRQLAEQLTTLVAPTP